jgi:SNF2 family DNA or RNA helicase
MCDSMGLGKSLSVVTLTHCFSRHQITHGKKSQVLLICPTTLISNWSREFLKWLPRGSEEGSDEVWVKIMDKNYKTLGERVNLLKEWQRHALGTISGVKKGVR